MPVGGLIAGGANIIGGLIKGFTGGKQKREGKKLLSGLEMPEEQLAPELLENQRLARENASAGMPSEQYAQAMKNIQRNQLTAFRAAKDRRGGLGSLSGILQGTNDAALNLSSESARMRAANQSQLLNVNSNIASWKSKLFDLNKRTPYEEKRNYAYGLIGAGNQNKMAGLDQATSGFGQSILAGTRGNNNYGY